jgi:membrane fusion protein (multidrug efflux system)
MSAMSFMPPFRRVRGLSAVALSVFAALAAGTGCSRNEATRAADATAAPAVSVIEIRPETVNDTTEWNATLDGYVNAQIRPQVSGYLVTRLYREGAEVHKGDVLFEIDARPFVAALEQAKAKLAEARAALDKAQRDVTRDTPLAEQRAVAQSQLDNDVAAQSAAEASVQSADAAVSVAQLNLDFTKVTSLVDGVAAIATAQIGDLVGPTTLLTTVSQVDPIKAYFPLSDREYLGVAGRLNQGDARLWNNDLTLILSDGSVYPSRGRFLAADRDIDVKTGTIRVSAAFPNPNRVLRPGQAAHVRAETATLSNALLVPQRAVTDVQGASQVRIVDAQNHVATRPITLGGHIGNRWIVTKGLATGDRVVVEGPPTKDGAIVAPTPYAPAAGDR